MEQAMITFMIYFHTLAAETRKYYRNAIPMSDPADSYWAMYKNNNHLDHAHKIASDFDPRKETTEELV